MPPPAEPRPILFDQTEGSLCFVNAGHPPPLRITSGAPEFVALDTAGKPLGWMSEQDWQDTVAVLTERLGMTAEDISALVESGTVGT